MSEHKDVLEDHTRAECLVKGKCAIHDVEIERRKTDRKELHYLRDAFLKLETSLEEKLSDFQKQLDSKVSTLHEKNNRTNLKVIGVFCVLGLLTMIMTGSFFHTNLVETRSEKRDHSLRATIDANAVSAKEERAALVSQVVDLLTSDAEQKEWQRGVIRQLEQINVTVGRALEKTMEHKNTAHPPPSYYNNYSTGKNNGYFPDEEVK